jgi:hypothetical protein
VAPAEAPGGSVEGRPPVPAWSGRVRSTERRSVGARSYDAATLTAGPSCGVRIRLNDHVAQRHAARACSLHERQERRYSAFLATGRIITSRVRGGNASRDVMSYTNCRAKG